MIRLLLFFLIALCLAEDDPNTKTGASILLLKGRAYSLPGKVRYARMAPGQKVNFNWKGRYALNPEDGASATIQAPGYDKEQSISLRAAFNGNPIRDIHPAFQSGLLYLGGTIPEGNLVVVPAEVHLKLQFAKQILIDVGPNSIFLIESAQPQKVHLKVIAGRIRIYVPQAVQRIGELVVEGPNAYVTSRRAPGVSEALFDTGFDGWRTPKSSTTVLQGEFSIDYPAYTKKEGLVYHQTDVLEPKQRLLISGEMGFGTSVEKKKLDAEELTETHQESHPKVNARASYLNLPPSLKALPGTGLGRDTMELPLRSLERVLHPRCRENLAVAQGVDC